MTKEPERQFTEPPRWSRILSSWPMKFLFFLFKLIPFVILYWLIEYHDHPPDQEGGHYHPIHIHDTIYIDRIDTIYIDTLYLPLWDAMHEPY